MAKGNVTKVVAGVLALAGAYFIFRYFKKPKAVATPTPTPTPTPTTPSTAGFPLKKGSRGTMVSSVQQWILKIDKNLLPRFGADGSFGSETEAAVNKLLGKKTIDSNADVDRLIYLYNQKTFPLVTAAPKSTVTTAPLPPFFSTVK